MKSEVIVIGTNQDCTEKALNLTEEFAATLPKKGQMRLHLLAEEMMNLFRSITGEMEAEYWIENNGDKYALHIDTETIMYSKKRSELMELSSKKENAAAKGVIGKIREAFELALLPEDERDAMASHHAMLGFADPTSFSAASGDNDFWKMSDYISGVENSDDMEFAQEAKDELEKSIIANLAKEVTIGIRGGKVSMTVEWTAE